MQGRIMANVLEASGLFWVYNPKSPKAMGTLSDKEVSGSLIIESNGVARLRLNGFLSPVSDAGARLTSPYQALDEALCIQGILKETSQVVLLCRLKGDGTRFSNNGISYENLVASDCLVSDHGTDKQVRPNGFRKLIVDLNGLEDWVGSSSIVIKKQRGGLSAVYQAPPALHYKLPKSTLTLSRSYFGPFATNIPFWTRQIEIREMFSLVISTPINRGLADLKQDFRRIEDLLLLLIGFEVPLKWPRLKNRFGNQCTYYFRRDPLEPRTIGWMDCWTTFPKIKDNFGDIFASLLKRRDELGPGLSLYLGTRRAQRMYLENQFVTLVWGLESMHRRKLKPPTKLEIKVQRILNKFEKGIDEQTDKDRDWLEAKLKNAGEPSLAERLIDTFKDLPLGINRNALNQFCSECAKFRNDISHYGGQRHDGDYQTFINRLTVLKLAIECLYHALLLHEIGVKKEILTYWFYTGPSSYGYSKLFAEAGLKRDVPRVKRIRPAPAEAV